MARCVACLAFLLLLAALCSAGPRLREDQSLKRFFANARRFRGAEAHRHPPADDGHDSWSGLRSIINAVMGCPGSVIPGLAIRYAIGRRRLARPSPHSSSSRSAS